MYSELIKQKYERYEEEKSSYKHYVKKVDSLSRDKVGEKDKYMRVAFGLCRIKKN